jgi:hypothetical protein
LIIGARETTKPKDCKEKKAPEIPIKKRKNIAKI